MGLCQIHNTGELSQEKKPISLYKSSAEVCSWSRVSLSHWALCCVPKSCRTQKKKFCVFCQCPQCQLDKLNFAVLN